MVNDERGTDPLITRMKLTKGMQGVNERPHPTHPLGHLPDHRAILDTVGATR